MLRFLRSWRLLVCWGMYSGIYLDLVGGAVGGVFFGAEDVE